MPGLTELRAGAGGILVTYTAVEGGASLRYTTGEPVLVDAIHAWFRRPVDQSRLSAERLPPTIPPYGIVASVAELRSFVMNGYTADKDAYLKRMRRIEARYAASPA